MSASILFVFIIGMFFATLVLPGWAGRMAAHKQITGRYTAAPKPESIWRNTETGEMYVIGANATTVWYGNMPEKNSFDRQRLISMEYREFYSKCVEMTEEELACEEGLQALAKLP